MNEDKGQILLYQTYKNVLCVFPFITEKSVSVVCEK